MTRFDIPGDGSVDWLRILATNARTAIRRDNKDWVTTIVGYEGSGKSNLSLKFARLVDPGFGLHRVAFSAEDALEIALECKRGDTVVLDESVNGLFSRDAMKSENKGFAKIGQIMRGLNLHWIFCIPNLQWMDPYWREHRTRVLMEVQTRGIVKVKAKSLRWQGPDPYFFTLFTHFYGAMDKHADSFEDALLRDESLMQDPYFAAALVEAYEQRELWDAYMDRKEAYMREQLEIELKKMRKKKGD